MFRVIKSVFYSLLLVAAITSCEKEMSVENGQDDTGGSQSGTAAYTLTGAPLPCTDAVISGNYVVNTELDISNTVVINVDVMVVGTYTIATGLINGIRFTATGTYSTTGPQTITLFGSGVPVSATSGLYSPGTDGCSFIVTATTATVQPVGPIYYDANIGGQDYREQVDGNNFKNEFGVSGTANDVFLSSTIKPVASPAPANTTELTIIKGILHSYTSVNNLTFKTFFSPGLFPYGANPVDGIEITWKDEAGNLWSTNKGTADQSGSAFIIESVEDEPGQTNYSVRVTASYNCKLYDDATNVKTVTGGEFVGVFSKL